MLDRDKPFFVDRLDGQIIVTANLNIIEDLVSTLETLLELSKDIKKYRRFLDAEQKALDPVRLAEREAKFKEKVEKTYKTFKKHLKTLKGDKSEAIKATYKELNILRIDAEILISEGKRLEKNNNQLDIFAENGKRKL